MAAIAAITGQTDAGASEMFADITRSMPSQTTYAEPDVVAGLVARLCTRVGLAPAVDQQQRDAHIAALRSLTTGSRPGVTVSEVNAWDRMLRDVPEKVPTVYREPVVLPAMPDHQQAMWRTLLDFEASDPPPWVLVGGQMTALHLLEHGVIAHRPTDDGDIVVGVWTRRDALRTTTAYLSERGFAEQPTGDGYGYRFVKGRTTVDVMIPEGLDRQRRYPTTGSGRPGMAADGGNQALTRAERLPVNLDGRLGLVRRPILLGALVSKAHAWIVDSRDPERHAQDLIALAELALANPRAVIRGARPDDRRAMRKALRSLPPEHRLWRASDDPAAVRGLLTRLAKPPT
jgi:hypothetical protein